MKNNLTSFIAGGLITATLLGGAMFMQSEKKPLGGAKLLEPEEKEEIATDVLKTHPKNVTWDKPDTDLEWAEDVKKENFDIKSTGKLEEMITAHTEKLAREEQAYAKHTRCPECIREDYREILESSMTGDELETEIEKQTNEDINNRLWSIDKLKQSLERMHKEVELRDKGVVVVEGEASMLLGGVKGKIIRYIND